MKPEEEGRERRRVEVRLENHDELSVLWEVRTGLCPRPRGSQEP